MSDATPIIDLDADLPADTYQLQILKPGTAQPIGWAITLAGPAHPKAVAYKNARQQDELQRHAAIEAQQANGRKVKPDARTSEEENLRTVRWLVSRVVDWTPVRISGETFTFSDETATRLFLDPKMAAYTAQIVDYLTSERAFMPTSASS